MQHEAKRYDADRRTGAPRGRTYQTPVHRWWPNYRMLPLIDGAKLREELIATGVVAPDQLTRFANLAGEPVLRLDDRGRAIAARRVRQEAALLREDGLISEKERQAIELRSYASEGYRFELRIGPAIKITHPRAALVLDA